MKTTIQPIDSRALRRFLGSFFLPLFVLALMISTSRAAGIEAFRIAGGFTQPLYVCSPPGDTGRLFVAEQVGKIKIINLATGNVNPIPFLDISDEVAQNAGGGILGMTFDPNYAVNGRFYVSWTTDQGGVFGEGVSHIARFTVSADPDIANRESEIAVLTVDQPQTDHNLDWIGFSNRPGDEGNLYICSGDGGHIEDNGPGHVPGIGNAQSTRVLLGKILRIHIEDDGSYTIPPNNPFFGSQTEKQEIWAYGLRNPWRASFDRQTGNMFIGDVGEGAREEVDVNERTNPGGGQNFGWRVREGLIQNKRYPNDPPPPNAVDPVLDYEHDTTGECVVGGYVYRGRTVKPLRGLYVFGDCFGPEDVGDYSGRIYTMTYKNGVASDFQEITSQLFPTRIGGFTLGSLSSFGEDASGELYIVDWPNGNIFKIRRSRN